MRPSSKMQRNVGEMYLVDTKVGRPALRNRGHGFGDEQYMVRRGWDYFVKHLLGAEPPQGYELKPPATVRAPTP